MSTTNNDNISLNSENKGDAIQGDVILTGNVQPLTKSKYYLNETWAAVKKCILWVLDLLWSMVSSIFNFGKLIVNGVVKGTVGAYRFFERKIHQFKNNDLAGRLSFGIFGASSFANKQYVNGVLFVLFEVGYILFMALFGFHAIYMLGTLGVSTGGNKCVTDELGQEWCTTEIGDNSIMILIYGLLCILSIFVFLYMWNRSINSGYNNYRIRNFMRFKDIFEKNIELSERIDNEVKEAVYSNVKKADFIKNHKYNFDNSFIADEEIRKEYDNISKEVIKFTIRDSFIDFTAIKENEEKLASMKAKLEEFKASRNELLLKHGKNEDSKVVIERNTAAKVSKREALIAKQTKLVFELTKTHAPYARKQSVENASKFEKFNEFYKVRQDYKNQLAFYNHYDAICQKYDSLKDKYAEVNEFNAKEKVRIAEETKQKVAAINAKFDDIVARKVAIITELKALNAQKAAEIKSVGKNPTVVNEIEDKYFTRISMLSGDLHKLPEDKAIKAMRKDEIKEVTHAGERDRKYLKTNFTSESYSKEETINFMLLEYKFDFEFAKRYIDEIIVKDGKDSIRHLSNEEVLAKINELQTKLEEYENNHQDKFVGRPKSFREQLKGLTNENFHISILSLPILGVVFFTIVPLMFSILIAFTNYAKGHIPPTQLFTWIGFDNFITLFAATDPLFSKLPSALMSTLGWTIIWTIVATFSNYFLGIILALLINKKSIKFKKLWRTIFIMTIAVPQFISLMSISSLLKDTGPIGIWWAQTFGNRLGFGTDSTNNALMSKVIILLVNIWIGIPYTMLSTTGILMNIPTDLYESATVDGAGPVTQFTKITLPYILFVTGSYLITQFIGNINNFNVIFFLTGGGPLIAGADSLQVGHTDLLITFLYKMITSANNPQFGIASTVGIVIFIVCAFFSIIMYNKSSSVQAEDQFQ